MEVEQNQQLQNLQDIWEQIKDLVEELFMQCGEKYQMEQSEKLIEQVIILKSARMVAEQMEEGLMCNQEASLYTVNRLLNQWKGALEGLEKVGELEQKMELMQKRLGGEYKELQQEKSKGKEMFEKIKGEQRIEDMKVELEEKGEELEEEILDEDIEEEYKMDDVEMLSQPDEEGYDEGESFMDIDEADYTQLIDKSRFDSMVDTCSIKTKLTDDYLCSIDIAYDDKIRRLGLGSGDDSSYLVTEEKVLQQKTHKDTVQIVRLSKDGKLLATGAMEETLCIYDAGSGELKQQIYGCSGEIRALDWHQKGKSVVLSGGADGSIWIHNGLTGQFMATFQGHQKAITHAQFTRDGKKVLSAAEDGLLRVWDPLTSQCLHKITGHQFHQQSIECIDQHPSTQVVLTAGMDYFGCLSNYHTGKVIGQTPTLNQPIFQAVFSQAQEHFYLGTSDGQLPVYDTNKLHLKNNIKLDGPVTKLVPLDHYLLASTAQGFIYLIDPRQPDEVCLQQHTCPSIIHDFVYDTFNHSLLVAAEDGYLRQYPINLPI